MGNIGSHVDITSEWPGHQVKLWSQPPDSADLGPRNEAGSCRGGRGYGWNSKFPRIGLLARVATF